MSGCEVWAGGEANSANSGSCLCRSAAQLEAVQPVHACHSARGVHLPSAPSLQAHVELDRSERLAGMASELQHQLASNDVGTSGRQRGTGGATSSGQAGWAGGSLPTSPRCGCLSVGSGPEFCLGVCWRAGAAGCEPAHPC